MKPGFKAATCRTGLIARPVSGRLVEMDVRLDQAGTGKAPSRVVGFGCTRQPAINRDDLAAGNADIQRLRKRAVGEAGITNEQVHTISSGMSPVPVTQLSRPR